MADPEPSKTGEEKDTAPAEQPQQADGSTQLRAQVPAEIRDVSFPVSVRGYDRRAVDVYISRVNRVIAELEVSRSPQSAVRHALDRVAEQTKTILQEAREAAEKITAAARAEGDEIVAGANAEAGRLRAEAEQVLASARAEADDLLTRSRTEAEQIVARSHAEAAEHRRRSEEEIAALQSEAQARMDELQADTEAVGRRRHELLAEMHSVAAQLHELAGAAASRFAPPESAAEDATKTDLAPVDSARQGRL